MKVLILSDSHGWKEELQQVIERHQQEVEAIFHCGDSELPVDAKELKDIYVVKGNCDPANFPPEIVQQIKGLTIYVTHGHLFNVKMTPVPLTYRSEEVGANIVCFGHTHKAVSFQERGVIYINPGSVRLPKGRTEQTYSILEIIYNKKAIVKFYDRNGMELSDMRNEYVLINNE